MYGYDDLYNSPLVYRPHQRTRGPLLPVGHVLDEIADQAFDEAVPEIYGGFFDSMLSGVGKWAKGVVDPQQRLQNWKDRIEALAERWEAFDASGDSQADTIAHKMIKLAAKIKDREPGWRPDEEINDILARYAEGAALGFQRKKRKGKKALKKQAIVEEAAEQAAEETMGALYGGKRRRAARRARREALAAPRAPLRTAAKLPSIYPEQYTAFGQETMGALYGAILGIPTRPEERIAKIDLRLERLMHKGPGPFPKRRKRRIQHLQRIRSKLAGYGAVDPFDGIGDAVADQLYG
jgi:hypothetical protein